MSSFNLQVVNDQNALARLTTNLISKEIDLVLDYKERFQLALSGGSTPCKAYSLLSKEELPWGRVDVCLGDERWVSSLDASSNSLMLRSTLLAYGPGSKANFHSVPTVELSSPEESAREFSNIISNICIGDPPRFDLILLGLGDDGHTASLFPNTSSLVENDAFTTVGEGKGQKRITLTAKVLSAAAKVIFLVSGKSKSIALRRLLDPSESSDRTPAKLVQPKSELIILADKSAAEMI